jgi:KDO2-lipid IV(A) lauroyltransferase
MRVNGGTKPSGVKRLFARNMMAGRQSKDASGPPAARQSWFLRSRHAAEWLGLSVVLALFRLLPPNAAAVLMGKAWRALAPFNRRHKRALDNLAHALPDLTERQREAIARDMWENLGRIAAETLQLDRIVAEPDRFEFDVDDVKQAVGTGGAVVVSLHAGNWEVTSMGGLACGWSPVGVYKALKNQQTEEILHDLRARLYPGGLLPKGHDTARRLLAMARKGERIAMLADLQDRRGAVIPFFGREAYATLFPASIACAANVPLIACRVIRLPNSRFRIEARVVDFERTGERRRDAENATRAYHAMFEAWIREHPQQWMWIMRKWL